MRLRYLGIVPIPSLLAPPVLGLALLGGCGGDDGSPKPMALTEENKANIEAERKADAEAKARKPTPGQP